VDRPDLEDAVAAAAGFAAGLEASAVVATSGTSSVVPAFRRDATLRSLADASLAAVVL